MDAEESKEPAAAGGEEDWSDDSDDDDDSDGDGSDSDMSDGKHKKRNKKLNVKNNNVASSRK